MGKSSTSLTLKVREALPKDAGRAIARIDPEDMGILGLEVGDILEIEGKRNTVAKIMPCYAEERGKSIIQIDGISRDNAQIGLDEKVKIRRIDYRPASKITLSPLTISNLLQKDKDTRYIGSLIEGLPVTSGDRVRATLFGSRSCDFKVLDTAPEGVVLINPTTLIRMETREQGETGQTKISYEDIGGLGSQIQRIREMIELPLRYPEVFERLGIDAPKGVLLFGPPGTGKTLIARAVANETDAYFTHISGPEVMGKFYGESLMGDEFVLIFKNGIFERRPIADIVASKDHDLRVPCFGSDGRIKFGKVTGFYAHPFRGKLLRVRTSTGRLIRVTNDHSLFTLNKNGLQSIKTSELVTNHSFIAVPKRLPFAPEPIDKLDLCTLLRDEHTITMRGSHIDEIIHQAIAILGRKQCAQILEVSVKYMSDLRTKHVGIPLLKLQRLVKAANLRIDPVGMMLFAAKGKHGLPTLMNLNEDLCLFFGLWLAEGSYSKDRMVRIDIHENESQKIAALCERLFGKITLYRKRGSKGVTIIISSIPLVKLMRVLGFVSGAHFKRVPTFLYNLSRKNLAAFLRGYFSGDGSVNKSTPAPQVEVSTASSKLADDICYLLLFFGIVAKVYDRPSEQSKRLCFADSKNLEGFLEIGFLDITKNAIINEYLDRGITSRRDHIPVAAVQDQLGYRIRQWKGLTGIGTEALKERFGSLPGFLEAVFGGDLYWDKVATIEELPDQPECVYDIGVEPGENFIAGFGGIFAHNSEARLRALFEEAQAHAPAIVFIDEIESIAPKREEMGAEKQVERRVVSQLLALMDGLESRGQVIVMAATNVPNIVDPALRRPGRFDREISIPIPDKNGRLEILQIHTRGMPLAEDVNLEKLAEITHGFVGADLEALAREAAMSALRKILPKINFEMQDIPYETLMKLEVTMDNFQEALKEVEPSAIREVFVEVPDVKWEDVGGLEDVKRRLMETVEWPLKYPELFKKAATNPPKGILLYGRPGTGKTLVAKAVANESGVNFISIKGPQLVSKFVGESERGIREIFRKAKQASPAILFFDELDAIVPMRSTGDTSHVTERVISQFLTEMDGIEELKGVLILGATNRLDIIDPAILRPGRFDLLLELPIPDGKTRMEIFKIHTKGKPLDKDVNLNELVKATDKLTGADIEAITRSASILAIREFIDKGKGKVTKEKTEEFTIKKTHFDEAMELLKKQKLRGG